MPLLLMLLLALFNGAGSLSVVATLAEAASAQFNGTGSLSVVATLAAVAFLRCSMVQVHLVLLQH